MFNKKTIAWALYDWANSVYAIVVMTAFFPIYFKQVLAQGLAVTDSTFYLGLVNSLASAVIVILAPFIGTMADQGGLRKKFLLTFAALGIVMAGSLAMVQQGHWVMGATLYAFATLGFMGANVFYDAMLVTVTSERHYDRLSAFGFAIGYFGSGLFFAFCVYVTLNPGVLGLSDSVQALRFSFVAVAIWWALFTLPLLKFVPDIKVTSRQGPLVRSSWRQLLQTLRHIRQQPEIVKFLIAYWLYIDGVDTMIRMATDYGLSIGFDSNSLIKALLITQFVAFPATLLFGYLSKYTGAKTGILIAIAVYVFASIWGYYISMVWEFYALAIVVGLVQGGVQALSRSLYARMIPKEYTAEYFGFYNMLGKSSVLLGPLLMGSVSMLTGNPRFSILSIIVLFVAGAFLLCKVDLKAHAANGTPPQNPC